MYAWCVCGVIYGVHMYVWYGVCVVCFTWRGCVMEICFVGWVFDVSPVPMGGG